MKAAKVKPVTPETLEAKAQRLRNEAHALEHEARGVEEEAEKLRAEAKRIEERGKQAKLTLALAAHLAREETSGDISWLPYEEQERYRRIADLAVVFVEDWNDEP